MGVLSSYKDINSVFNEFKSWNSMFDYSNSNYFRKLWKENYPELMTCDHIVKCDTCSLMEAQIHECNQANDYDKAREIATKKQEHLKLEQAHRTEETTLRELARRSTDILTINSDHMAKKFLVKFQTTSANKSNLCSNLKIHPGGHYIANENTSHYTFFEDKYSEES